MHHLRRLEGTGITTSESAIKAVWNLLRQVGRGIDRVVKSLVGFRVSCMQEPSARGFSELDLVVIYLNLYLDHA